jgi:hypothetical protein
MIVGAAVRFVGVAYLYFATWTFCNQERSLACRRTKAPQMGMDFFQARVSGGGISGPWPEP